MGFQHLQWDISQPVNHGQGSSGQTTVFRIPRWGLYLPPSLTHSPSLSHTLTLPLSHTHPPSLPHLPSLSIVGILLWVKPWLALTELKKDKKIYACLNRDDFESVQSWTMLAQSLCSPGLYYLGVCSDLDYASSKSLQSWLMLPWSLCILGLRWVKSLHSWTTLAQSLCTVCSPGLR